MKVLRNILLFISFAVASTLVIAQWLPGPANAIAGYFTTLSATGTATFADLGTWSGTGISTPSTITSTVATGTSPLTVSSTTNVANLNASTLSGATFAAPGTIGSGTRSTGAFTSMVSSTYNDATGHLFISSTAPTLSSGGCTGAAITTSNNTAAFAATVGTSSCSGSEPLVFTLPSAAHSWACNARDINQPTYILKQTGTASTTSVTITNYGILPGTASAWVANDVVEVTCTAY